MRKRVFYLDFIRAIATFLIVLTHYNALFIYNFPSNPSGIIFSANVFNVYLGDFAVSLFLILSGASLMLTYGSQKKINLKKYFLKRILTIFPIYWLSYLVVFSISFSLNPSQFDSVPVYRIVYTILGVDGYLSAFGIKTFFLVGEWFLGFILIFYLFAPLMMFCINKFPKLTALFILLIFVGTLFLGDIVNVSLIPTARLLEIGFGMYFVKYKRTNPPKNILIIPLIIIQIMNLIIRPPFPILIQAIYIGISGFMILGFLGSVLQNKIVSKSAVVICNHSYACFIIHHVIICAFAINAFNLNIINTIQSLGIFILTCLLIIVASFILTTINNLLKKTPVFLKLLSSINNP